MKPFATVLSLLLPFSAFCAEPEAKEPPPRNLSFELQIIDVPALDSLSVIQALQDPAQAGKVLTNLHTLVEQNKAYLAGVHYLSTKAGNRAVCENIKEFRYPIEFEAEVSDPKLLGDSKPSADSSAKTAEAKPEKKETIVGVPSSFETRNIGTTIVIESQINLAGTAIDAQIEAQRVYLKGMEKQTVVAKGIECTVSQPMFINNKTSTNMTLPNNVPVLTGTFDSPEKDGWIELFILRARIQDVR